MSNLRFQFRGDNIGDKLRSRALLEKGRIADAARLAMNEARKRIIIAGREDIKKGGKFGPRWLASLGAEISPPAERTSSLILRIFHTIPYAHVFEYSAKIFGKPLLWIPLPWNPFKVRAKEFPGKLFRVDREGKNPLLMTKTGATASAMYVGVKSVFLRRRFHLRPIIKRVAKQMPFLFKKAKRITKAK
jgi:hypothetical protein